MHHANLHSLGLTSAPSTIHGLLIAAALALLVAPAQAVTDRYVSVGGQPFDPPGCTTCPNVCTDPAKPCPSIHWALAFAGTADTIKVSAGTYNNTSISFGGNHTPITIEGGWAVGFGARLANPYSQTILRGNGTSPVFDLHADATVLEMTIDGVTIENGSSAEGGGIRAHAFNTDDMDGEGRLLLTLQNSRIRNNSGTDGAGIWAKAAPNHGWPGERNIIYIELLDDIIEGNSATGEGAVLFARSHGSGMTQLVLNDNQITNNSSTSESIIELQAEDPSAWVDMEMARNRVLYNTPGPNEAVVELFADVLGDVDGTFENNLFAKNTGGGQVISCRADRNGEVRIDLNSDTIADNAADGLSMWSSTHESLTGEVTNSIIVDNGSRDLELAGNNTVLTTSYSHIIDVFQAYSPQYINAGNNSTELPGFVDPLADDYHLAWGAAAMNTGSCATAPDSDFEGDPRPDPVSGLCDRGADEVWNAPAIINNGETPGNTDNYIDGNQYQGSSVIHVLNQGCSLNESCSTPGTRTTVEIVTGGIAPGGFETHQTSHAWLRGGTIGGTLKARDASRILVYGFDFKVDGLRVPMGRPGAQTGVITGELELGGSIDIPFFQDGYAGEYNGDIWLTAPRSTVYLDDGATHTIDHYTYSDRFVAVRNVGCIGVLDCGLPGAPTTLWLTDGQVKELQIFDTSMLQMEGGYIHGSLLANDSASLLLQAGSTARDVAAFDSANVVLGDAGFGTSIGGDVLAADSSEVSINWSAVGGDRYAVETATLSIRHSGADRTLFARDHGEIILWGYDFRLDGFPVDYGYVDATSGRLSGYLAVDEDFSFDFERDADAKVRLREGSSSSLASGGSVTLDHPQYQYHRLSVKNELCHVEPHVPCETGDPTTLYLVPGGAIGSRLNISHDSSLSMSGGVVGGSLRTYHDTEAVITGGRINNRVLTEGNSIFSLSGDSVIGRLYTTGYSSGSVSGGRIAYGIYVDQFSSLVLDGGLVQGSDVTVANMGSLTMNAGSVTGNIQFQSRDEMLFAGGSVLGNIEAQSGSVTMTGGSVGYKFITAGFGPLGTTASVSGGSIGQGIEAGGQGSLDVRGGEIGHLLYARDQATVRVHGSNFAVNGAPVELGTLSAQNGNLTGILESGDAISVNFLQGQSSQYSGTIELVPEPALVLLQLVALVGIGVLRGRMRG